MMSKSSTNVWIRRQQCPCGDWKCFIKNEGDERDEVSECEKLGISSSSEIVFTPYVGQPFKTDDEAFEYYSSFARRNGFSIRKARSTESHNLGIYRRDYVCYRSGFNQPRKKANVDHPRDRKSVRCGCDAKLYLTKEIVDGDTQWYVSQFSNVHNHELLEDDQVRLLPAYRKIQEADQERILLLSKAGFPVNRIIKILELEKGVKPGQLPFIEKDIRNFVRTCKKTIQESDALLTEKREADMMELLEACKAMGDNDGDFAFNFTTDANGKVENIGWSYGDSVRAYTFFGDVVQFDISYQSVTYGMMLGIFSGIDNHGNSILFGCVLILEDCSRAFAWALQTFVQFMGGRHPQTIVTDLGSVMRDAIPSELPNTKHVVSLWYIMPKLGSWFSLPLGLLFSEFKSEFEMLGYMENIEDFEPQWEHLIARFGLGSDKHVSLLSSYRASWAFSYIRGCFVAQITTDEYTRSLDMLLKGILGANSCLRFFFEQLSSFPGRSCYKFGLQIQGRNAQELVQSTQYATTKMANGSYVARHYKKVEGGCLVIWIPDDEQIHCSCKGFEHSGILCRHALRLLVTKNCFQVPDRYLPFRWRLESSLVPINEESTQFKKECYHSLRSLTDTLLSESLVSKERFCYVEKKLARLVDHVKGMPVHEAASNVANNNSNDS